MTQAERIISLLGGVRRTSEIVGAPLTTVQSWRDGGVIPAKRQFDVIEAAKRAGINITGNDFFDGVDKPGPRKSAAYQSRLDANEAA